MAIEFAAVTHWDGLISALHPTPLDGDGPGIASETLDLVALADAVRSAPPSAPSESQAPALPAEPPLAAPTAAGFVPDEGPAGSAPGMGGTRREPATASGVRAEVRLPAREAEPLRPRMTFGKSPGTTEPKTLAASVPAGTNPEEEKPAPTPKPIPKPEVKLPERAPSVETAAESGEQAKPQPRPTLVPAAMPPKPASTIKPAPMPMPKPVSPRPTVVPRPLKGSPAPAVLPAVAEDMVPATEAENVPPPRPTLVPDRKIAEPELQAEAAATALPIPSFGGAAAARPSLTLTGEALRADQIEVPSNIPALVKIVLPLLLVAGGGVYYFLSSGAGEAAKPNRPRTAGAQSGTLIEQGWVTEWASDPAGSRRGRQLTLYKPSLPLSDYQFVFTGRVERGALGWVIRAGDTKNYYAMKISQEGSAAVFRRWAVVEGRESSYSEKRLALLAAPGQSYQILVDVQGPRFTVALQGEPIEVWTDNRLPAGAVGFLNEREEQGRTTAVQLKYAKRPAGN